MRNRVVNAAMLVAALASVVPAHAGLIINATFDGTITSDPNAAPIETAINTAIQMFENTYTNNISVDIYFQEGGGLGESDFYWSSASYSSFYSGLVANEGVNSPAIMGLDANGGDANTNGGNNPEGNSSEIEIKSANARAVGIDIPPACVPTATGAGTANGNVPNNCSYHPGATDAEDGIISLDTAILNPGSPGSSGAYDLIPVVEHEIDEILGLGSAIDNCDQSTGTCGTDDGYGSPQDLYRYTASGARSPITVNCSNPGSAY
ncbi:MAG: NF038122 family metalloprotease, partial [Bryobacteraceae bacterium]